MENRYFLRGRLITRLRTRSVYVIDRNNSRIKPQTLWYTPLTILKFVFVLLHILFSAIFNRNLYGNILIGYKYSEIIEFSLNPIIIKKIKSLQFTEYLY